MELPLHRVAIIAFPRTGTNFLASSLGSLRDVIFHPEPFNPSSVHLASGPQNHLKEARDADPLAFLHRLEHECRSPVLGIKLLPNHAPEVREHVIADPAWQCIVLFRPNFLAVHASQLAATQTGVWAQSARTAPVDTPLLHFEPRRFLGARESFRLFYDEVLASLDAVGKAFLPLNYIDLLDPLMMRNAARFVGITGPLDMSSHLIKQGHWDIASAFENRALVLETLEKIGRPNWAIEGGAGLAEGMRDTVAAQ